MSIRLTLDVLITSRELLLDFQGFMPPEIELPHKCKMSDIKVFRVSLKRPKDIIETYQRRFLPAYPALIDISKSF